MSDDLKPCPFCGGVATLSEPDVFSGEREVSCDACGGAGPVSYSDNLEAITAWNHRADTAEVIALRARVAAAEKLAEAAVVARERLLSHAHDQYDGVWSDEDFAEETAEIDAALAAYEATK